MSGNQARQPKGATTGGQFVAMNNSESTLDLTTSIDFQENDWVVTPEGRVDRIATIYPPGDADSVTGYRLVHFNDEVYEASQLRRADSVDEGSEPLDLTQPVKTNAEAVAWCEAELERITQEYSDMVDAGKSETPEAWDLRDSIEELRDQLVDHQRDLISEQREELERRQDHFDVEEKIFDNVCAHIEIRRLKHLEKMRGVDWRNGDESDINYDESREVRDLVDRHLQTTGISGESREALAEVAERETQTILESLDFGDLDFHYNPEGYEEENE